MNILQCGTISRATRAAQRREHILEISRRLFIEKGFHGTGVAQIASTSGVKVGQIYRDFSCKEDIIAALALRDFSQLLDETTLENAIRSGDKTAVRQWILSFTSYDREVDLYRLMPEIMAESARNPRISQVQEEIRDRVRASLMAALTAWVPAEPHANAHSDLVDLITTLGGGLYQWIVLAEKSGRDYRPMCAQLRAIIERELDALEARGAG